MRFTRTWWSCCGSTESGGRSARQINGDLYVVHAKLVGEELDGSLHHVVQPHIDSLWRALAREGEEISDDADTPLRGRFDAVDATGHRVRVVHEQAKQLGASHR